MAEKVQRGEEVRWTARGERWVRRKQARKVGGGGSGASGGNGFAHAR